MVETKIDISKLKSEGGDVVKDLAEFIKEKTDAKVETGVNEITVDSGDKETISRTYLRVLLRKFLHREELRDAYRVTGGEDNKLVVRERKVAEEE